MLCILHFFFFFFFFFFFASPFFEVLTHLKSVKSLSMLQTLFAPRVIILAASVYTAHHENTPI